MRITTAIIVLLILSFISLSSVISADDGYALVNATIIPVTGNVIENGTLIIKGNQIVDVGRNVDVPPGTKEIDCSGLYVYPGMINAMSTLGLSEIGAVPVTNDANEVGTYNAHLKAIVAVNVHSVHIPITRVNGITTALVVPRGGIISGQSVLLNLAGWTPEEMSLKSPAAIHINFPQTSERTQRRSDTSSGSTEDASKRVQKQRGELMEVFERAKVYAKAWQFFKDNPQSTAPERDLTLEALVPVVQGELPVIIHVNRDKDIKSAVEFAEKLSLKYILAGVTDGWKIADYLAEKNAPVLFGSVIGMPDSKEPYDTRYASAGIMHDAGVKVAIYNDGYADVRSLPYHAGTAAAFGLPKEEALKAVTIYPAQILGVDDKIGSLEIGKLANIVIADGDILEMRTKIKHLFINGENISLESKHTKLYEKFRARPKK